MDGHETERVLDLSPDPEVLAERKVPQGQLLRVLVLHTRESGHVAGDSPEGVEQGRLHACLKEQQVHVNLGHGKKRGLLTSDLQPPSLQVPRPLTLPTPPTEMPGPTKSAAATAEGPPPLQ